MRLVLLITVVALLSSCARPNAARTNAVRPAMVASYYGTFLGREYVTTVSGVEVAKAPAWSPTKANPPLPVRGAERAASEALTKVVGEMKGWHRQEIILDNLGGDYWIYRISFRGPSLQTTNVTSRMTNATSWRASLLPVVVLMNGEAIPPKPKSERQ